MTTQAESALKAYANQTYADNERPTALRTTQTKMPSMQTILVTDKSLTVDKNPEELLVIARMMIKIARNSE